jgi:hypothetical protein
VDASFKKAANVPCQCSTSVDVTTTLVSADGVLVPLLLLIFFSFWGVVREGGNASPCKTEKQELQRSMRCIKRDGCTGRILSVEFFHRGFRSFIDEWSIPKIKLSVYATLNSC